MARLSSAPKNVLERNLPEKDKLRLALKFLIDHPDEDPATPIRIWKLQKPNTLQKAWRRERKKIELAKAGKTPQWGGQNKILRPDQERALIRYAANQCLNGGKGATKQMMYNCAMYFRVKEGKEPPSWKWFQDWLKKTPELHVIKTKPIASHRVDIHTEHHLREWFETEYRPALEVTGIKHGTNIHNMDEKGARICMPAGEEVVVPIGIKEIYTGIPENRMSVTVVECISADGKAIPPVIIIIPGKMIMASWFTEKMTGHELITVSDSGYTNEGICMAWLDHFIKHNNCGPDKEWHILLIDGATCHNAPNFRLKAFANKIWLVKFPSHQTHLLQPCDVGCFRTWKHWQQVKVMDAIRSYQPEYNLCSFLADLPEIRERTFTVHTIKHAFQNAGIWPVSFKAVKKKLKEYGKKKKKDTGLEFLEYSSSSSEEELPARARDASPLPDPRLQEEYVLPMLPKPPSSYTDCRHHWEELHPKISAALTSPSRARYEIAKEGTYEFLMLGSLAERDLENYKAKQVAVHKAKLNSRVSISHGGTMLASEALTIKKDKEVKVQEEALKRATSALAKAQKIAKDILYRQGVNDREEERLRKKWVKEQRVKQARGIPVHIPPERLVPIRDREKQQTAEEAELVRMEHQALYDKVSSEQDYLDELRVRELASFSEIPLDPEMLALQEDFRVKKNPLSCIRYESDEVKEEDNGYIPSSPLGQMALGDGDREEEGGINGMDLCSSPPRSVATIDSFDQRNQDFLRFQ